MNAQQAFLLSKNSSSKELKSILQKIKEKATQGEYQLHIYEVIVTSLIKQLQELGFEVTTTDLRNEPTTTISWNLNQK